MCAYPLQASLEERTRHVWNTYVTFGVNHPDKFKAAILLRSWDPVDKQARRQAEEGFEALTVMMLECLDRGALKDEPPEFGAVTFIALMNMTVEFILQHPAQAERFRDAGFTAFWHALTTP